LNREPSAKIGAICGQPLVFQQAAKGLRSAIFGSRANFRF
jgi:hypothetical protein